MQIELLMLDSNAWKHLTVFKQMSSGSFKTVAYKLLYKSYITEFGIKLPTCVDMPYSTTKQLKF